MVAKVIAVVLVVLVVFGMYRILTMARSPIGPPGEEPPPNEYPTGDVA
jgi:hypothetical protein